MAMPQPSTSKRDNSTYNRESSRLLKRIIRKLKEEETADQYPVGSYYLLRAMWYTGLHPAVLAQLKVSEKPAPITEIKLIDRSVIHNELMTFYLEKKMLPTTRELFDALHGKIPPYVDLGSFRNYLVKMDYVWKKIIKKSCPYTLVIMERPSVTNERYQYLKKIIEFRKTKSVFFVDAKAVHANGFLNVSQSETAKGAQRKYFYAVSKTGVHFKTPVESFNEESFEKWIDELKDLSTPSVFVFYQDKLFRSKIANTPNIFSLKCDMLAWLELHDIPCTASMSKAELYTLIQRFTDTVKIFKVEKLLRSNDHEVLWLPKCIDALNPANVVNMIVNKNIPDLLAEHKAEHLRADRKACEDTFNVILDSIPEGDYAVFDEYIHKEEEQLYKSDTLVDEVLDDLIESTRCDESIYKDADSDLPDFSDSD